MDNLSIAIPSKGRLYGETFRLVKTISEPIVGVYVYVDEVESKAYSEVYPEFNIIPHNKSTINEIRLFIQEHQNSLGNNMLMMDDDIQWFFDLDSKVISINTIIKDILEQKDDFSFFYFFHYPVLPSVDDYYVTAASVVYLSLELYNKDIRYRTGVFSEDFDFYFNLLLNEIPMKLLPYVIIKNISNMSHFDEEFRNNSIIETYLLYGDVITFFQDFSTLCPSINGSRIRFFKEFGPTYSILSDRILLNIRDNMFPGYRFLRNWYSSFSEEQLYGGSCLSIESESIESESVESESVESESVESESVESDFLGTGGKE